MLRGAVLFPCAHSCSPSSSPPPFSLLDAPKAPLMAGAATSNITPELGGEVVGGFAPYPCTNIHDELHARCLVLDDGKTKLALVVCDLLGLHRSVSLKARELIEKETGIPAANVLISGTHTHSAVNALGGPVRGYFSDLELTDFQQFVARRIADGVRRAFNLLRPRRSRLARWMCRSMCTSAAGSSRKAPCRRIPSARSTR
jgi:hypothetical protein